jgi:hypothetical protein
MIIWHVETSYGSRFDWANDEEHLRQQLIEYNNDVLNGGEADDQLPDDATLDEAVDKIEEQENLSYENVYDGHILHFRERDTILAALRLWQHAEEGTLPLYNRSLDIFNEIKEGIAENSAPALDSKEIDALCERLNR